MEDKLAKFREKLLKIYEYLHVHPEKSWHEVETTKFIYNFLQQEGLSPKFFKKSTGLYVDIGKGIPKVGLRADIDALWQEVDGEFKANHSCGHDGHMTMAIGAALLLNNRVNEAAVRIIFQPAEEKGAGALSVIEEGIVDHLHYLFSVHVRPNQELADGYYSPAIYNGASATIEGEIRGEDAHGARPHLGTNAIEVGASLVQMLSMIHQDPMVPASVKVTKFHAGGDAANVIPGTAKFSIDVRAQRNDVMQMLQQKIFLQLDALAQMHEVKINYKLTADLVAAEVDENAKEILRQAIIQSVGEKYLQPEIHTPGGEDFHFYAVKRPHLKASMLGLGCGLKPGLHHPKMSFNTERLLSGVDILSKVAVLAVQQVQMEEASNYARISNG